MSNLIEYQTDQGEKLYFEITSQSKEQSTAMVDASHSGKRVMDVAGKTINDAMEVVNTMGNIVVEKLRKIDGVDKAEVEFGFKIGGKGHIFFIASGEAEANIKIKLVWEKGKR